MVKPSRLSSHDMQACCLTPANMNAEIECSKSRPLAGCKTAKVASNQQYFFPNQAKPIAYSSNLPQAVIRGHPDMPGKNGAYVAGSRAGWCM